MLNFRQQPSSSGSWLDRLKRGLKKTGSQLTGLFGGTKVDEQLFDVQVESVNVLKVQPKPKKRGLFHGTRPGWKKAVVKLKEGHEIEIFQGAQV